MVLIPYFKFKFYFHFDNCKFLVIFVVESMKRIQWQLVSHIEYWSVIIFTGNILDQNYVWARYVYFPLTSKHVKFTLWTGNAIYRNLCACVKNCFINISGWSCQQSFKCMSLKILEFCLNQWLLYSVFELFCLNTNQTMRLCEFESHFLIPFLKKRLWFIVTVKRQTTKSFW